MFKCANSQKTYTAGTSSGLFPSLTRWLAASWKKKHVRSLSPQCLHGRKGSPVPPPLFLANVLAELEYRSKFNCEIEYFNLSIWCFTRTLSSQASWLLPRNRKTSFCSSPYLLSKVWLISLFTHQPNRLSWLKLAEWVFWKSGLL